MSKRDYYEVLEVTRTATEQEIKSSYRRLALKFHPDRNPGDKASEDKFKEAAEAYAVLIDTDKRHMYDRFGHAGLGGAATGGFDPNTFTGFEDILGGLGDIFGFGDVFGGGRRRGGPQRGADLRYDLEISFQEAAKGTEASIQIPRQTACETCGGSGAFAQVDQATPGGGRVAARHVPAVPGARAAALSAGILHGRADVRPVPRIGIDHCEAVSDLPWRGTRAAGKEAQRTHTRRNRNRSTSAAER